LPTWWNESAVLRRWSISRRVYGNVSGLKSSHVSALEKLYRKSLSRVSLVTPEIAAHLAQLSREIKRQLGIIVDRKGAIEYVVVGDASRLEIPDLGRIRAGRSRFRGIRLIHTHLHGEPLSNDDLTDLSLLSLDCVTAVDAREGSNPLRLTYAHLLPVNPSLKQWEVVGWTPAHSLDLDFERFIRELENEFARRSEAPAAQSANNRAVLVYLDDGRSPDPTWEVEELGELARSAGLRVVDVVRQRRPPDPRYLIGRGRLCDLIVKSMQREADLLVFCPDLSPAQVKAIGDLADIRVIDRSQLILDIFAQRALSRDGKLQVELAQLRYLAPRLLGAGIAMSRLMGGIGGRGPGETKLESDRRRIKQRIQNLEKQLLALASQRRERRKRRDRNRVTTVAIVGYTNAGKSSLLNTLTHAKAIAENKLFATLDPFSKRLRFPHDREIVLTDTVGFIRDLPPDLKAAFRATLEELDAADLLIHVVDASSPRADEQLDAVEKLLAELDLDSVPRITVFNKIDRLPNPEAARNMALRHSGIAVCALDRQTLRPLVERIESVLWEGRALSAFQPLGGSGHEEELHS